MRAQQELEEAGSLQREVGQVIAQAHHAFAKVAALNPEAMSSMTATIRMLEEAIDMERQLRRQSRLDAEEEADQARQWATDSVLNALGAVRRASNYVRRELEESKSIANTADTLRESSLNELRRAHDMMEKARRLLEEPCEGFVGYQEPVAPPRRDWERYQPPRPPGKTRPQSRPGPDFHEVARSIIQELGSMPPAAPIQSEGPDTTPEYYPPDARDTEVHAGATDELQVELNDFLRSMTSPQATPLGPEAVEKPVPNRSAEEPSIEDMDLMNRDLMDFQPPGAFQADKPSAAEEAPAGFAPFVPPTEDAEQDYDPNEANVLSQLQESLASLQPDQATSEALVLGDLRVPSEPDQPEAAPIVEPQVLGGDPVAAAGEPELVGVADIYTGIFYISFTPATDSAKLWDAIESVAGVGRVISLERRADGSGLEFTVDMGSDVLVMQELKKQIPGAAITGTAPDRLHTELASGSE